MRGKIMKKASDALMAKHGALLAGATKQIDELTDQLFSLPLSAVWEILDAPTRAAANVITSPSNSTPADTLAPLTLQLDHLGGRAVTLAVAPMQESNFNFLMVRASRWADGSFSEVSGKRSSASSVATLTMTPTWTLQHSRSNSGSASAMP